MLYREIIVVCSEIHTKHIKYTVWAELAFFSVTTAIRKVTSGLPVGIICDCIDSDDGVMVSIGVTGRGKRRVGGLDNCDNVISLTLTW